MLEENGGPVMTFSQQNLKYIPQNWLILGVGGSEYVSSIKNIPDNALVLCYLFEYITCKVSH